MNGMHTEPTFLCNYLISRNGYCKHIITSTPKSKHIFKNHKLHKNEDERTMLLVDLAYIYIILTFLCTHANRHLFYTHTCKLSLFTHMIKQFPFANTINSDLQISKYSFLFICFTYTHVNNTNYSPTSLE